VIPVVVGSSPISHPNKFKQKPSRLIGLLSLAMVPGNADQEITLPPVFPLEANSSRLGKDLKEGQQYSSLLYFKPEYCQMDEMDARRNELPGTIAI
jgi:hypothetical protein